MNKRIAHQFVLALALGLLVLPQVAFADLRCEQLFARLDQPVSLTEFLSPSELKKVNQIIATKARLARGTQSDTYFRGLSRVGLENFETNLGNIQSQHGETTWVTTSFEMALSYASPIANYHFQNTSSYNAIILELSFHRQSISNSNGITASVSLSALPEQDLAPHINRIGIISVSAEQVAEARAKFPRISELEEIGKWVEENRISKSGQELFLFAESPLNSELNYNELFNQFFYLYLSLRINARDPAFIRWIDIPARSNRIAR